MHTSTELADLASVSISTAAATLEAHKIPVTEVRNPHGGRPKKLYHITAEEFILLQSKRKLRNPAAPTDVPEAVKELLIKPWGKAG